MLYNTSSNLLCVSTVISFTFKYLFPEFNILMKLIFFLKQLKKIFVYSKTKSEIYSLS